jgi:hypothetical protein
MPALKDVSSDFNASNTPPPKVIPYMGDKLSSALQRLSGGDLDMPVCRFWGRLEEIEIKPIRTMRKVSLRLTQPDMNEVTVVMSVDKHSRDLPGLSSLKPGQGVTVASLQKHLPENKDGNIHFKAAYIIPAVPEGALQSALFRATKSGTSSGLHLAEPTH